MINRRINHKRPRCIGATLLENEEVVVITYSEHRDLIALVKTGGEVCEHMYRAVHRHTIPQWSCLHIFEELKDSGVMGYMQDRTASSTIDSRGLARITPSLVGPDLHFRLSCSVRTSPVMVCGVADVIEETDRHLFCHCCKASSPFK